MDKKDKCLKNYKLAAEWHPTKNGDLEPQNVTLGSAKKVWWQCKRGHEWEAMIYSRDNGRGCPYCSGKFAIIGETDLESVRPELAEEWNSIRNGLLKSTDVTLGSTKKVWWQCKRGHEWEAMIYSRGNGNGCPYCSGKYTIIGETDLESVRPELAKEWHFVKNEGLKPVDVTEGSHKKVWWKCKNGHEWEATIYSRNNGTGCPYCAGKRAIKGKNDLLTKRPDIAKEWHTAKNSGKEPLEYLPNANIKVWWKCSKGHEWKATINSRNNGSGCPYCAGQRAIKGENDLLTKRPDIANEWHSTKNACKKPEEYLPNANVKVWWKCSKGHEWKAMINNRNNGTGCPYCAGKKHGRNSFS